VPRTVNRKPPWIKFKIPGGHNYRNVKRVIEEQDLHIVCVEAVCPNIGECLNSGTATFLILGNVCTRNCRYCAVTKGVPGTLDTGEPARVAEAVCVLGLKYAVVTSVTRDDLADGGAGIFAQTVSLIRGRTPVCGIELLIPDFRQSMNESLDMIIASGPDVINHNIEVVNRYYHTLRPKGDYDISLSVLEHVAASGIPAKSGLMIGFGESIRDIRNTLLDLYSAGCRYITIGQYCKSTVSGHPVDRYYHPDEFAEIGQMAEEIGFTGVMSGPMVRSSYNAHSMIMHP